MSEKFELKTILWTGGGTAGSVTPLLTVAKNLYLSTTVKKWRYFFVGTKNGPEKELVSELNQQKVAIKFLTLPAGKWRRYFSIKNFCDIFKIIKAFFLSFRILIYTKADLIISAGGFVSVPLVWAGAIKNIPILIHQQDLRPGLANKLMAPFARVVTVSFEKSLYDYGSKAIWIGNPVEIDNKNFKNDYLNIKDKYNLDPHLPLLLVTGGVLGAKIINELMEQTKEKLKGQCQIIHLTGQGKIIKDKDDNFYNSKFKYYQTFEKVSHQDFLNLLSLAKVVLSRCGLGSLTELAAYHKAAILIPIPRSHQEDNASVFAKAKAAVVLNQNKINADILAQQIKELLNNDHLRQSLQANIAKVMKKGAVDNFQNIIAEILA